MKPSTALVLKRFISILLVLLLISSFVLLSGCQSGAFNPDPDEQTDEPKEDEEDEILEVIKNGKFDQYNDPTTTAFPVVPKNWSSATGDSYGGQNAPAVSGTDVRYGTISVKPEYYDANSKDFKTSSMTDTLDNPGYPEKLTADGDDNDKIFMLENIKKSATKTTTSSSISVPINSYAIISVWVKTFLVDVDKEGKQLADLAVGQGAVISITGGVDKPVILHGINTKEDWKEYQFIIEGSSVSSKNITLGLGLGTGSPLNDLGYTEGFAFFANVKMTYITKKAFEEYKNDANVNKISFKFEETNYGTHKKEDVNDPDKTTRVCYSFKNSENTASDLDSFSTYKLTKESTNNGSLINGNYTDSDFTVYKNTGFNSISSEKIKNDLKEENFPFADGNITVLQKKTNEKTSIGIVNENFLTVKEGEYYKISFWVKTSDVMRGGLNAYLVNKSYSGGGILPSTNYKSFSKINTTAYKLTAEEKDKVTNANKWEDWRQYSFYVDGGIFEHSGATSNLSLEIWFGAINLNYQADTSGNATAIRTIDSKTYSDSANFPEKDSYALISNIEVEKLFASVYSSASSGDNTVTGFSLSSRSSGSNSLTNGSFNNVKASDTLVTDKPMSPANFTGSYRNGAPQGNNVVSGIINTNLHESASWLDPSLDPVDLFRYLKQGLSWNSLLMIYNKTATAYGYASDKITLSANTYYEISVNVKTTGSAKANIYLVDSDGNILGNYILDKYGEKKISGTNLSDEDKASVYNPFYEEKYDSTSDKYKQDLEYENSAENKLLRKGTKDVAASTIPVENPFYDKDYNKKDADKKPTWKKETTKYFMYDANYCDKELSSNDVKKLYEVIDLDYNNNAQFEVTATGNEFVTYTFFIKTGNTSKNVTLELWNGSKYSSSNPHDNSTGTVFFDAAISSTSTKETFYEYALSYDRSTKIGEILNKEVKNAMFFDMSGYDNIADPKASPVEPGDDHDHGDDTPFNWLNLIYIIPTSVMVIALLIVVIKKLTGKKKPAEETVTEKPTYTRKTSKKSVDKDDAQ